MDTVADKREAIGSNLSFRLYFFKKNIWVDQSLITPWKPKVFSERTPALFSPLKTMPTRWSWDAVKRPWETNHSSFPAGTERRKGSLERRTDTPRLSSGMNIWHCARNPCSPKDQLLPYRYISILCPFISPNAWLYHPCSHFETLVLSYFWVPELTMKLLSPVPLVLEWSQERWQEAEFFVLGSSHHASIHFEDGSALWCRVSSSQPYPVVQLDWKLKTVQMY